MKRCSALACDGSGRRSQGVGIAGARSDTRSYRGYTTYGQRSSSLDSLCDQQVGPQPWYRPESAIAPRAGHGWAHPAQVNPQQRAERAFPISRAQVLEEITQETFFSRLRRFFHWYRSSRPTVRDYGGPVCQDRQGPLFKKFLPSSGGLGGLRFGSPASLLSRAWHSRFEQA
jgi:hypothetical protein